MAYRINKAKEIPALNGGWDGESWKDAEIAEIAVARPESSDHHPEVKLKLQYDRSGIFGLFRVDDRYVVCKRTGFNDHVCKDSCVEFFFQPFGRGGYFNFEFNCGGAVLSSYITDHTRTDKGFKEYTMLGDMELRQVDIYHSLPATLDGELAGPLVWELGFHIPFPILEKYCGAIDTGALSGTSWRANFYKCADESSHRHWLSWQPVAKLNFHLPEHFGEIIFA